MDQVVDCVPDMDEVEGIEAVNDVVSVDVSEIEEDCLLRDFLLGVILMVIVLECDGEGFVVDSVAEPLDTDFETVR